jgi:CBS domain containing-hemolysin-like protein
MSDFLFIIVIIFAIVVSALCAGISSGVFALNRYHLKHKAQFGDINAKLVYSLYAQRYQLMSTLLIANILANTTIVVLINSRVTGFLAVLVSAIIILVFGELLPLVYIKKNVIYITAKLYPVLSRMVRFSSPVTKFLASLFDKWIGNEAQVIYSKEELLKMFDGQELSKNSDIAADEVRMIRKVLEFGDKKIRDVMTPRRMVTIVSQGDEVGPLLMDELHKSGYSRFPVVAEDNHMNFIGTLYLRDLVGETELKKVKNLMSKDVRYIHEEESLDHALRTFLRLHHHLFIVVNNFEEFVGVLSIEDVLEEVIGKEIVDEFDQHDDLRKVARSLAVEDKKERQEAITDKKVV